MPDKAFPARNKAVISRVSAVVPVLCKIWREDGIWNAVADELPVAVFGESFEEAHQRLGEALVAHLVALQETDSLHTSLNMLRQYGRQRAITLQEMPHDRSYVKFEVALQGSRVVALI